MLFKILSIEKKPKKQHLLPIAILFTLINIDKIIIKEHIY